MKWTACIVLGLAFTIRVPAFADFVSAKKKFSNGDYAGAENALQAGSGVNGQFLLAQVHIRQGRYAKALEIGKRLSKHRKSTVRYRAQILLAKTMNLQGQYRKAHALLSDLLAKDSSNLHVRHQLGLAALRNGDAAKAARIFDWFIDQWNRSAIDENDAEQLFYVAEAARYSGAFQDANDMYRAAVKNAPSFYIANIEWGHLFLEKYATANAQKSFSEVLARDPNHPAAHVGIARAKLDKGYDVAGATKHLNRALAVNPNYIPALLVRAGIEIDQKRWRVATASLAKVLSINANSYRGRALMATIHWLRGNTAGYQAEKQQVMIVSKNLAEFFHTVARYAEREHRYAQAIGLEKQAVGQDPKHFRAMQSIGTGYLRLGQEKRGLDWLRKSWQGDEYNARTYNMLELFDNVIPNDYQFARTKQFKVRYPRDEKKLLRRYIEPLLDTAFASMVKRYQYRPKAPIVVELYKEHQHYSVRTVGLPNLGALGVCFGSLITTMSPSVGGVNWAMILWHELAHVFAIKLSEHRVARWYTEGLSEYETIIARPEWRRENDADVWQALQNGTLPSVTELDHGFVNANPQRVMVSYHLSSMTIEFIVKRFGFDAILAGLSWFAKGLETPQVIAKITGLTVEQFDSVFRTYLRKRLAVYAASFALPTTGFRDVAAHEKVVATKPSDPRSRENLALAYFFAGNAKAAQIQVDRLLRLDANSKIGVYLAGELAVRKRQLAKAKTYYQRLIRLGGDSADVRSRLGMIAKTNGDFGAAVSAFSLAKRLDPQRSYPYLALSQLFRKQSKMPQAMAELEGYAAIEQMEHPPLKQLTLWYHRQARWDKVRQFGEMAIYVNPFDGEVFVALGDAHAATDPKQALFAYDSALLAKPPLRRPALVHLGRARVYFASRKRAMARNEIKKALKYEPNNIDALQLKKQVR